eukprot:UN01940
MFDRDSGSSYYSSHEEMIQHPSTDSIELGKHSSPDNVNNDVLRPRSLWCE